MVLNSENLNTSIGNIISRYGFTNSKIVLIVNLSLYLKTKKLFSVFTLFMTNMSSFPRTRLPTISCVYVNLITSNA
jgi:hypothetical protein